MLSDRAFVAAQYASSDPLKVRIDTHRRFTVGPDLEPAVDAALALRPGEALLDVGTGNAAFPARLRASGHVGRMAAIDLHAGMLPRPTARSAQLLLAQAAADHLPFADATFDVVTARHMLYHVPDVPAALGECRRVLTPGGRFLAVTNHRENMAALWEVIDQASANCPALAALGASRAALGFSDHNAESLVSAAFGNARVIPLHAHLEFPTPEPVLRYFHSFLHGLANVDPEQALNAFARALASRFPASGPWVVPKTVLLVTATRA
jgi:SAM-dependent methyltransferase